MQNDPPLERFSILIVDDETNIRKTLSICLESRGHRITSAGSFRDAKTESARQVFDLCFLDLRLGQDNGLDLIPILLAASPGIKIIVVTAYAAIDTAVEAIRRGADDYIPKPFTPEQVDVVLERISRVRSMERRIDALQTDIGKLHPEESFETKNPEMLRALETARQTAKSDAVVLLRGPSGTGKTVLARAIHSWSGRSGYPFCVVSCPTLSPELLESELFGHVKGAFTGALRDNPGRASACEGGTLFLDEIGDLPLTVQPKLLRFIQDKEYERVGDQVTRRADVRIIAATNSDLESAIEAGKFREDLYYRLNVIQIEIPPLSARPDDIEQLASRMLDFFAAQNHKTIKGFSVEALQALKDYFWPGNIRELRNVIERAVILCGSDRLGLENFPKNVAPLKKQVQLGDPVNLKEIEEEHIRRILSTTHSIQEAADILGLNQSTLWRRQKQKEKE